MDVYADAHNHNMRYLMRAFLFLFIILVVTALCTSAAAARDVKIALTDLKPNLFTDDNGKPAGFLVDVTNEIAAREGWNIIWVRGSLSESWARLSAGEIDLLPGVASTPERQVSYDFTNESALSVWSQVYARPDAGINTILDLEGKRIAVTKGGLSGIAFKNYAQKFGINATYIEKDIPTDVFSAVASGEADALVVYNTAGLEDAVSYGLATTPVMFDPTRFGFAVQKGKNADLLAAIDRYLAKEKNDPSSSYSQAMHKWFGIKSSPLIPPWFMGGLVAVAVVALLFVVMSVLLRREVAHKTAELSRQNVELNAAYEQLAATEESLRENYQELIKSEKALMQARKKLNLLNTLTFQDIQTGIFSLGGYLHIASQAGCSEQAQTNLKKGEQILQSVRKSMNFARKYQDLGMSPPRWQKVNYALLNALSHLDYSRISRNGTFGSLEIYADPLLEDVFLTIMERILLQGDGVTEVRLRYQEDENSITLFIEDNSHGIPVPDKEEIFKREYTGNGRTSLFLAREILSITDISIRETGMEGTGTRFEITVPKEEYRFGMA